jgi:hypothetical protein
MLNKLAQDVSMFDPTVEMAKVSYIDTYEAGQT